MGVCSGGLAPSSSGAPREHADMPIYDDLDDRGSHADFIERCRRDFESTHNALYAWEAWGGPLHMAIGIV